MEVDPVDEYGITVEDAGNGYILTMNKRGYYYYNFLDRIKKMGGELLKNDTIFVSDDRFKNIAKYINYPYVKRQTKTCPCPNTRKSPIRLTQSTRTSPKRVSPRESRSKSLDLITGENSRLSDQKFVRRASPTRRSPSQLERIGMTVPYTTANSNEQLTVNERLSGMGITAQNSYDDRFGELEAGTMLADTGSYRPPVMMNYLSRISQRYPLGSRNTVSGRELNQQLNSKIFEDSEFYPLAYVYHKLSNKPYTVHKEKSGKTHHVFDKLHHHEKLSELKIKHKDKYNIVIVANTVIFTV